jgi:hypothetical protein
MKVQGNKKKTRHPAEHRASLHSTNGTSERDSDCCKISQNRVSTLGGYPERSGPPYFVHSRGRTKNSEAPTRLEEGIRASQEPTYDLPITGWWEYIGNKIIFQTNVFH